MLKLAERGRALFFPYAKLEAGGCEPAQFRLIPPPRFPPTFSSEAAPPVPPQTFFQRKKGSRGEGKKKKRDKIGGWYAGGGKGVTSFAAHPFLRLINYKLIKLSLLVSSFP